MLRWLLGITCVGLAIGIWIWRTHVPTVPVTGIDVSHYQATVDWQKVAAHPVHFAFAKASGGDGFADPSFPVNWAAMKKVGIVRGAYEFYRPSEDPKKQAEYFISRVKLEPGDLPPVIDIETLGSSHDNKKELVGGLLTYLEILELHYGVKPIIYTGRAFWNAHMNDAFGDYHLWVAEYDTRVPLKVDGWNSWTFWQHSEKGSVAGISGTVDLNRFNGTVEELRGLTLR